VHRFAAEALKIPPAHIRVYTEIDTQFSPYEWQTIGSMFTLQGGRANRAHGGRLIQKLKETGSARCSAATSTCWTTTASTSSSAPIPSVRVAVTQIARGYMHGDGITVGEVAQGGGRCPPAALLRADENGQGTMGVTYTFGAQGCEIRIDKKTGEIIVDHFASAFDVGRVIHPKQIHDQVIGGVMMALGAALSEELKFDAEGHLLNPQFYQYHIPTYRDRLRNQTVMFVETPGEIGPFGARGLGEHPVIGVAPAILNAIYDATGIDFYEIPITPKKMKAALEARREREGEDAAKEVKA